MRGHGTVRFVVGTVAAAALTLGVVAAPASAWGEGRRLCEGEVAEQGLYVVGDAFAGSENECRLADSVITGDLYLGDRQSIHLTGTTVKGDIIDVGYRAGAHVDAGSHVFGSIVVGGEARLRVTDSTVRHSIRGHLRNAWLDGAVIEGAVNVGARSGLHISGSRIGGWVNVPTGETTVEWSELGRGLTTKGAAPLRICGTDIAGAATFTGSSAVTLGSGTAGEVPVACDTTLLGPGDPRFGLPEAERDAVVIGGSATVSGTFGHVTLLRTEVAGDLTCDGNLGPVDAAGAVVGGARGGQCS
jgi:hypothetical protein